MEQYSVEYNQDRQNKMEEIWARWLRNKEHLHLDTITGVKEQWKKRECSLIIKKPLTLTSTQTWVDAYIELEVQVGFDAEKGEAMTRHSQGFPASVEINEIKLGEVVLPQEVFDEIMKQVQEELMETCRDAITAATEGE